MDTGPSLVMAARRSGVLQVFCGLYRFWNSLKYWSANRAGVAAIAGAGDAVEGCVLHGEFAPALTREFGHVRPGGPPGAE